MADHFFGYDTNMSIIAAIGALFTYEHVNVSVLWNEIGKAIESVIENPEIEQIVSHDLDGIGNLVIMAEKLFDDLPEKELVFIFAKAEAHQVGAFYIGFESTLDIHSFEYVTEHHNKGKTLEVGQTVVDYLGNTGIVRDIQTQDSPSKENPGNVRVELSEERFRDYAWFDWKKKLRIQDNAVDSPGL